MEIGAGIARVGALRQPRQGMQESHH